MLKVRCAGLAALFLAASLAPAATAEAQLPTDVAAAVQRLTQPLNTVPLGSLPADPFTVLTTAVNTLSANLGFAVDHSPAILAAKMPPEYAGRLALLVEAVLACGTSSARAHRLDCAGDVLEASAGVIRTSAPSFGDVQAWPVLFIDGNGSSDRHRHDYVVSIDRGGNDIYDNNQGGNLIDIKFGPAGSAAANVDTAIGCEQVQGNFPAPTATAHDCIAVPQAVLIDYSFNGLASNDIYGVLKPPRTTDHNPPTTGPRKVDGDCTNDRLIRRIVLQGSGFEGNGMLIDVKGNDKYLGKTAAQGSGHIGGIGVLRDTEGNDEYLAIRNSQGFALGEILGLLHDDRGTDKYHTYMPRPKRDGAKFQEDGSGGVVDDTGLCDNLPRMVQGAALLGGAGVLLDDDGRDLYIGAPANTQQFMPGVAFFHSSQGFGCDAGIGILMDNGRDRDRYLAGPAGRKDGASISKAETGCAPAAPGLSVFRDDGP